jgi:hypothetical protein
MRLWLDLGSRLEYDPDCFYGKNIVVNMLELSFIFLLT